MLQRQRNKRNQRPLKQRQSGANPWCVTDLLDAQPYVAINGASVQHEACFQLNDSIKSKPQAQFFGAAAIHVLQHWPL
jgi:hypothetical protein